LLASYVALNLPSFCALFRFLGAEVIEQKLQDRKDLVDSSVWVSIDIVLVKCAGLSSKDMNKYLKDFYYEAPAEALRRGFYVHEKKKKVHSIYVFDRTKAMQPPDAPDIRLWLEFIALYGQYYVANRGTFLNALFEVRKSHTQVAYTMADILFGISSSRETHSTLYRIIDGLITKGILPTLNDSVSAAASPITLPPPSPSTQPSPRGRRSDGGPENTGLAEKGFDNELSREARGIIESADRLWRITVEEVKNNNIDLLAFEEWILHEALSNELLVDMCQNTEVGSKAFSLALLQSWRDRIVDCGDVMANVFIADGEGGLLKLEDARVLFRRQLFSVVGTRAHAHRMRRKDTLAAVRADWARCQYFKPNPSVLLVEYAKDANKYNRGFI